MPIKIGNINASLNGIAKVIINGEIYYQLSDGTYLELIEDKTIASATTSVTFSGLNLTKEDSLLLVSDYQNNNANAPLYLYANNNQTPSNYYYQYLLADGTSVVGNRTNNPTYTYANANEKAFTIVPIKLTNDGYFTAQVSENADYGTSGIRLTAEVISSTFTATTITQLDIVSSVANAIGVGSRFILYRRTNV